jgi:hypothetical protein
MFAVAQCPDAVWSLTTAVANRWMVAAGYGITAGTFTLYSGVRSVGTVEILPFLLDRQNMFARYNFAYWKDPRVTLKEGDGRHLLLASGQTYDIIFTGPRFDDAGKLPPFLDRLWGLC